MRLGQFTVVGAACTLAVCVAHAHVQAVQPGSDFTLAVGDRGDFDPGGHTSLRLVRVVADGRCPHGMACAATGPVTVDVAWSAAGHEGHDTLSVLDRDVGEPRMAAVHSCATVGAFVVRLRDVQPWPTSRTPIPQDQYRATFALGSRCGPVAP